MKIRDYKDEGGQLHKFWRDCLFGCSLFFLPNSLTFTLWIIIISKDIYDICTKTLTEYDDTTASRWHDDTIITVQLPQRGCLMSSPVFHGLDMMMTGHVVVLLSFCRLCIRHSSPSSVCTYRHRGTSFSRNTVILYCLNLHTFQIIKLKNKQKLYISHKYWVNIFWDNPILNNLFP